MKKYFVLGSGIRYSLSPKIFGELFKFFGDDASYEIKDVSDISDIQNLCLCYDGFNVTKPFKREIIKHLKRNLSPIDSVNTVTVRDMTGYSTDGDGFLLDFGAQVPYTLPLRVLLLGYGGAALAVANALKSIGAEVYIDGRDRQKVALFSSAVGATPYNGEKVDGVVSCVTHTFMPKTDKVDFCYDLRYNGEELKLDCPSFNGKGMLISQAILSYGLFTDKRFDKKEVVGLYLKLRGIL